LGRKEKFGFDNYEAVTAGADTEGASFGDVQKCFVSRFHHALYLTPSHVPLIVLIALVAVLAYVLKHTAWDAMFTP
jgi:hypothetical protein